jgi:hypothetical protein
LERDDVTAVVGGGGGTEYIDVEGRTTAGTERLSVGITDIVFFRISVSIASSTGTLAIFDAIRITFSRIPIIIQDKSSNDPLIIGKSDELAADAICCGMCS